MVRFNHVSKTYFGGDRVLSDINLDLNKGEFLYVVGGSGAGKSSFLRLLATEEAPSMGSVSLFGYDLGTASASTLCSIRQVLGYIPQNVRLIPDLSVADNVALSLRLGGRRASLSDYRGKVEELLAKLGLADKMYKPATALSGGEAQRVAVARALVRDPELIVADEPTGAQDREFTWSMMEMFLKANSKGATVLVATHDREIVRRVRKKCAVLKEGRLLIEEAVCFY
jgi:cell division transport system ATP-binding protein